MPEFEIVDVTPDLKPLFSALTECGIRYHRSRNPRALDRIMARLIEPPETLQIPTPAHTELVNSFLKTAVPFDGDIAARMLRLDDGPPYSDATWDGLSRAERKRARRLWTWAMDAGLDTTPQGRPHKVDVALVLYCARVVTEGCGQSHFKFSRPADGGAPDGPMWRALMAALPLAELFLARADGAPPRPPREIRKRAEAVADIITTARSKEFNARCRELRLGPSANDIAEHPAIFRLALTLARALRNLRNRARRK
jgi:hypothetical protein